MDKNFFKWCVILVVLYCGGMVCHDITTYYASTSPKWIDDCILVFVFIDVLSYIWIKYTNVMTIDVLKTLEPTTMLEYNIISDIETDIVDAIYVRPCNAWFPTKWRLLDYRYTINMTNCHLNKARLFEEKMKTVQSLLSFMEKKESKELNTFDYNIDERNTSLITVGIVFGLCIAFYFLVKYGGPQTFNNFDIL